MVDEDGLNVLSYLKICLCMCYIYVFSKHHIYIYLSKTDAVIKRVGWVRKIHTYVYNGIGGRHCLNI